jgi:hypothetical protein
MNVKIIGRCTNVDFRLPLQEKKREPLGERFRLNISEEKMTWQSI